MKKVTLFFLLVLAITIVSFSNIAYSKSDYTNQFNAVYGTDGVKGGTTLGSCITCHTSPEGKGYNPYGLEFMINNYNFDAIELLDSDGDGFDNITEIIDDTFPGDPGSFPVEQTNTSPSANAGQDQTVSVGATVTLDGSGSNDVDGDQLTLAWSFVSIPAGSSATLSNPTAIDPTFVADLPGTYEAQLIVNDGLEASAPDMVTISTRNSAPLADSGPDQTASVGEPVTLDGSGSSDTDGDALTYSWSFVSLPEGSGAALNDNSAPQPVFTVDQPGTYIIRLVVNDGTLDSDPDTVTVSTSAGNVAPVADAGADQAAQIGETITLNGSQSQDANGDPLIYVWSFVSVPTDSTAALSDPTGAGPSFVVDLPGIYVAQLIVNDGKADSDPDTVTISTENSAPVADVGKRRNARVGDTVALDGSQSTDPDGDSLTYTWSFVSRPEVSSLAAAPSAPTGGGDSSTFMFVPDVPGIYVVQLIVNDGTVDSDAATCTVRVRKQRQRGGKGKGGLGAEGFSYPELESYSGDFRNDEHEDDHEDEPESEDEDERESD